MDDKRPNLFREPVDAADLPAFLAQLVIEDEADDREHRMESFVIMLRSASSPQARSEEPTSELQSLMRISSAVFCLKKKTKHNYTPSRQTVDNNRYTKHKEL